MARSRGVASAYAVRHGAARRSALRAGLERPGGADRHRRRHRAGGRLRRRAGARHAAGARAGRGRDGRRDGDPHAARHDHRRHPGRARPPGADRRSAARSSRWPSWPRSTVAGCSSRSTVTDGDGRPWSPRAGWSGSWSTGTGSSRGRSRDMSVLRHRLRGDRRPGLRAALPGRRRQRDAGRRRRGGAAGRHAVDAGAGRRARRGGAAGDRRRAVGDRQHPPPLRPLLRQRHAGRRRRPARRSGRTRRPRRGDWAPGAARLRRAYEEMRAEPTRRSPPSWPTVPRCCCRPTSVRDRGHTRPRRPGGGAAATSGAATPPATWSCTCRTPTW